MIDTLEITKRLLKAKDDKAYAEEIAHILKEQEGLVNINELATKDDLKTEVRELKHEMRWLIGLTFAALALLIKFS
jgi:phosphosulfolactate phosphohydrolase-like enzyme